MSPTPYVEQRILAELGRANGPMCDDCMEKRASLKYRQQANRVGRKLMSEGIIGRADGRCAYCGKTKDVSWLNTSTQSLQVEALHAHRRITVSRSQTEIQASASLGLPQVSEAVELLPALSIRWEIVLESDGNPYSFPARPSNEMRKEYACPTVYRWIPFKSNPGDLRRVYIGEAQSLVDRIGNYRTGTQGQQTSFRLRQLFDSYAADGISICLERLRFDQVILGSANFTEADLSDKLFRRFLEHMMASYYRKLGWDLINA